MSQEILSFATQYSFYTGWITLTLGIFGSALNILVFTQLKLFRNNRSAFYSSIEAVAELMYQILSLIATILTSIYGDDATGRSVIWCKFRYILTRLAVLIVESMICCVAVDQFFSTNYHFNLREMCTLRLARYLTCTLICMCIVHSILPGLFYNLQESVGCVITNPIWLQYSTYFFYPILSGLLPITIASLFSMLAFRNVRRIVRRQLPIVRRRLDRQMTAMVLIRVVVFFCLQTPYVIYRVYALNFPISPSKPMEHAIGRLAQAIIVSLLNANYAVNFYLFVISSSRYRRQVKFLLRRYWKRWRSWCCFGNNRVGPANAEVSDINMELEEIN